MADDADNKRINPESLDPSRRAARGLESSFDDTTGSEEIVILDENIKQRQVDELERVEAAEAERAKIEEAAASINAEARQLPVESERQQIRIVMVTDDSTIFEEGSPAQQEYLQYASLFDELHVIVITYQEDGYTDTVRLDDHLWLYPTDSRNWVFAIYDAYRVGVNQLSFASGFRADVVAARDPFEAGLAGYLLSRRFDRPLQVQVLTNPFDQYFQGQSPKNRWLLFIAQFVLPRISCVCVTSGQLKSTLTRKYQKLSDRTVVLPVFRDLTLWRDATPTFSLKERYPQFKFLMLLVSSLTQKQNVEMAIDSVAYMISKYPTVGLVIVGDGPHRKALERKVLSMNLQNQIVFEPQTDDTISHMKSADLLLNTASFEENDDVLTQAAAAGLPLVTVSGGITDVLIEDGMSGFVCPPNDRNCFEARINEFLNNNQLRKTFSMNARDRVFEVVEQDQGAYLRTFAGTFERCLVDSYHE